MVKATPDRVSIYINDEMVAGYDRRRTGTRTTDDTHLPVGRGAYRHRGEAFWVRRAAILGEEVEGLAREIFALADALNPLRTVQAIVTLLEKHPHTRANNTARRARHFGIRTYRGVLDILRKALDFEPLPPELPMPAPLPPNPRFARDITTMLTGAA